MLQQGGGPVATAGAGGPAVVELPLSGALQGRLFRCFDTALCRTVSREILAGEIYRWPAGLPPPGILVDVGANVGASALHFARCFPKARIYAFEPSPDCLPLLAANLAGLAQVHLEPYGLFDRSERRRLHAGAQDPVTGSLGRSAFNRDAGAEVELRHAGEALHALGLTRIDGLKLDTEGSEVPIIEALAPFLPELAVLFVEYHSEGDRRRIELFMATSHLLVGGRIQGPHRGELTYARRASYPDPRRRDALMIQPPARGAARDSDPPA